MMTMISNSVDNAWEHVPASTNRAGQHADSMRPSGSARDTDNFSSHLPPANTFNWKTFSGGARDAWGACRGHVDALAKQGQARLRVRDEKAVLANRLALAVKRLPPAKHIQAWYVSRGDTRSLRDAIDRVNPSSLASMNRVLTDVCHESVVSPAVVLHLRSWLDAMLGPKKTLAEAKTACKKLFLYQHQDKVGRRNFGSKLYQGHADMLWDLLKNTHKLLAHPEISSMLYEPLPLATHMKRGIAGIFTLLAGCLGLHVWLQTANPRITR